MEGHSGEGTETGGMRGARERGWGEWGEWREEEGTAGEPGRAEGTLVLMGRGGETGPRAEMEGSGAALGVEAAQGEQAAGMPGGLEEGR